MLGKFCTKNVRRMEAFGLFRRTFFYFKNHRRVFRRTILIFLRMQYAAKREKTILTAGNWFFLF